MIGQVILEGVGLGAMLMLVCAIGIRNGAVGMVHLYENNVQERCISLGLTTREKINRNQLLFKIVCLPIYIAYVLIFVYTVNGARGFGEGFWQILLILLVLNLIDRLLLPLVYLYIGVLTASACLPENRLGAIAEALKKLVTWILTTALLVFTIYLSIVRIISGSADSATVKVAKAAISGVVPVVGGIIADASETVLAGAGMLKNTIGVFGMLAILAACAYPFLQLGVQYLLYKLTAYLASVVGAPGLCKLIDGLGGAFGLILGMTGGCALLLLISVLASVGAVMP